MRKVLPLALVLILSACLLVRAKVTGYVYMKNPETGELVPVQLVTVELVDSKGNIIEVVRSDLDGRFSFETRVKAGTYTCRLSPNDRMWQGYKGEKTIRVMKSIVKCDIILERVSGS